MTPPRDAGEIAREIAENYQCKWGSVVHVGDLEHLITAALVAYGEAEYRRGIKQASDLAFLHSCDDDCDVDYPGNGGGCASQIRDAIRNLSKEA